MDKFESVIAAVFVVGLLYLIKKLLEYRAFVQTINKIPGPPAGLVLGNGKEIGMDMNKRVAQFEKFRLQYGDIYRVWFGPMAWVVLAKPEYVRQVLGNHLDDFPTMRRRFFKPIIGNGLLVSQGDFWKRQRRLMAPVFTNSAVKPMISTIVEETLICCEELGKAADKKEPVDILMSFNYVTFDIIGRIAFATRFDSQKGNNVFVQTMKDAHSFSGIWAFLGIVMPNIIPFWTSMPWPYLLKQKKAVAKLHEIIIKIVTERQHNKDQNHNRDLLGLLINATDPQTGESLTQKQICDEVMTFLLAGHDTTANTMAWVLYHVSQHPDVERQILEEVDSVLGDRDPTYEDMKSMEYLTMVINETLRLTPTVPNLGRRCAKDTVVGGYTIPKGTVVMTPQDMVHHNPDIWEDPNEFKPERFRGEDDENSKKSRIDPYAFFPFSVGPRSCIGKNLAMIEATLILGMIFQRFTLSRVDNTPIESEVVVVKKPKNLKMHVIRRNK